MKGNLSTREKLIEVGLEILQDGGVGSLTVRGVAQRAGVNLGTFVYYFHTRDEYLRELLETWYAPLLKGISTGNFSESDPMLHLKQTVIHAIDFMLENARLISLLIKDLSAGEKSVKDFVRTIPMRHPLIIMNAIRQAQQRGYIVAGEEEAILVYLAGAISLPTLFCSFLLGYYTPESSVFKAIVRNSFSRGSALKRMEWALKGISLHS